MEFSRKLFHFRQWGRWIGSHFFCQFFPSQISSLLIILFSRCESTKKKIWMNVLIKWSHWEIESFIHPWSFFWMFFQRWKGNNALKKLPLKMQGGKFSGIPSEIFQTLKIQVLLHPFAPLFKSHRILHAECKNTVTFMLRIFIIEHYPRCLSPSHSLILHFAVC